MGNIDSLRTYPEQICRPCLKHLTRTNCIYCSKDFHGLQSDTKAICWKCSAAQKEHGEPTPCHFCQQRAAFGQKICRHCTKDSEKYGLPIECNQCKKKCAFKKPHDLKEKVGNQDLCYLCTRQYKLMQHRNKKIQNGADKKSKKYSPIIDISSSNHNFSKKRSLDSLHSNDGLLQSANKRQKISDSNYSQNPMCFHCKQSKKTLEEYKKSMESKLSDTNKRMEDYQRMAEKAKRKADQYRREKLNNVERIGELNGELEKERRKYHRDIQQKRESQEAENKRLYEDLQRANIDLKKADEIRNKLEENAETLKREKKELEKLQKNLNFDKSESEKKINKLGEKLNSKREKIGNWKKAYEDIQALLTKSDEKLRETESFLEVERAKNSELIQKMNEKNESGQDEELNQLKSAILEKEEECKRISTELEQSKIEIETFKKLQMNGLQAQNMSNYMIDSTKKQQKKMQ